MDMLEQPGRVASAEEQGNSPSLTKRYLVSIGCILVAFAIRYFLTPLLGEELPFMLFIAASLIAAWYAGAAGGGVALLLGLFLADYFFLPKGKPAGPRPPEMFYFVRYVFTASLGIALIEVLHRNRRALEREIARRARSERTLMEAEARLRVHAQELERAVAERTAGLSASLKALQELLYHIGHNFRAPLRAMEGYSSLLLEEYAPKMDATGQRYATHICASAERMDELIQALLAYGRLGYVELALSNVNVEPVIEKVLFSLAYEIQSRKATVKVVGPFPEVMANGEVLSEVLSNLIENAIKFNCPGEAPEAQIRSELFAGKVRIWVEDHGIGIDPQYHEKIFEPFETLSPQTGNGTGMGLAIVKQGMKRMGGGAGVESRLGTGSRFWIELSAVDSTGLFRNGHLGSEQVVQSYQSEDLALGLIKQDYHQGSGVDQLAL